MPSLKCWAVATTGYAKDILKDVLNADVALVETVAHTESALKFYEDPHVIVDVGGQDIKIIILHNGRVKDFKLNTQCSAGNGYFLQSTVEGFGLDVTQYADLAFSAQAMPVFGYGCAVFMQSDIVNFQRQGGGPKKFSPASPPCCRRMFSSTSPAFQTSLLLGRGLCCKAERRTISPSSKPKSISFATVSARPESSRKLSCTSIAESQAQSAQHRNRCGYGARDARRRLSGSKPYAKSNTALRANEETRCHFCKNDCLRTFIDIRAKPKDDLSFVPIQKVTKVPLMHGEQRLIIATCEKGMVEDVNDMKDIKAGLDTIRAAHPNFVDMTSKEVFRPTNAKSVADTLPTKGWAGWAKGTKERRALMEHRKSLRIGIPRVLNIYTYAPLFNAYFESLGVQPENIIYSDYTSSELYRAGASRGAIDPCFPAKIGISHVYNLIQEKHRKKPLDAIFFPMYDVLHSPLVKIVGANACPTVTATPETGKAAFTKENDVFAENNVKYLNPVLNFADRKLFAHQMLQSLQPLLGLSQEENDRAVESGFAALKDYEDSIRWRTRGVMDQLEREDRIGAVMLGRPYHHDPGLNHEILDEFQKLGYPIFSQSTMLENTPTSRLRSKPNVVYDVTELRAIKCVAKKGAPLILPELILETKIGGRQMFGVRPTEFKRACELLKQMFPGLWQCA
jgi:predicted nucleotide-binding protein (sugar kinase/HSP70/actin superfamily)